VRARRHEVVFGAASGFAYTAALSYAMVVKNAAVDPAVRTKGSSVSVRIGPLPNRRVRAAGPQMAFSSTELGYVPRDAPRVLPLLCACCSARFRRMPRLLRAPQ